MCEHQPIFCREAALNRPSCGVHLVELEKSFQEWCNTWGPFRSGRVSARAEDNILLLSAERFSLAVPLPEALRDARPGRDTY